MAMCSITISLIAFAFMFAGALVGALLRRRLPHEHLNADSRDVVKLGAGLIATQAALVVGLLVSSAKGSFDTANAGISQGGAKFIMIDHFLSRYGPEAAPVREQVRQMLAISVDQIWPEENGKSDGIEAFLESREWSKASDMLRDLSPKDESQRALKGQAMQVASDLTQLRWLLIEQSHVPLPTAFLVILVIWFTVLFAMFTLLTPGNWTVRVVMLVCALAVSSGVFLTIEMSQPVGGYVKVSSAPLKNALKHMGGENNP